MSRPRDAQATKDRILDAAFREFTARGFAGARVDEIASRAQVNKALLYQHYGDKESLFKTVLECKMHQLSHIRSDPEHFPSAVGEFFDFHAANPWISRLALWEALDFGTEPVPNEEERQAAWNGRIADVEAAQRAGLVDSTLDPRHTFFTLVSVVGFWFAAPQLARLICGGDPYSPASLAKRRAHVVETARRILEVR